MSKPSTPDSDGHNGRDQRGRFSAGNRCSKGNVLARKAAQCRAKLFETVSGADFTAIVRRTVAEAKRGEPWAVKLLFAYLLGEPLAHDVEERIAEIEKTLGGES